MGERSRVCTILYQNEPSTCSVLHLTQIICIPKRIYHEIIQQDMLRAGIESCIDSLYINIQTILPNPPYKSNHFPNDRNSLSLTIGNPEMLTSTIILPLTPSLAISIRTNLVHLTLTPHLRHISTPLAAR
jgi:hypothetical protein